MLELIVISTLNGVLFGMLLFLMASGLTVIFSMLGVLNFAHASFYMLGAFFGFQISRWFGFWPALIVAPLLAGAIGAGVERYGLRHVHKNGHVAELLFTFGLALRSRRSCQIIWGRAGGFSGAAIARLPAFTIFSTNYPAYKMFMLLVSIVIFVGLLVVLKRTDRPDRAGAHPTRTWSAISATMSDASSCWCSASAPALAAVAGVIAGPALVTQSNMAGLLGPILFVVVVVGGLGSCPRLRCSLLIGLVQTFAVSMNGSLAGAFGPAQPRLRPHLAVRHLERDHRADRADHALCPAGADRSSSRWACSDPRHIDDLISSAALPDRSWSKTQILRIWMPQR